MADCGVNMEVFDLFSYFGLYFLGESVVLDGIHTKELVFRGFVEFQFFVFAKWPILQRLQHWLLLLLAPSQKIWAL